MASGAVLTKFAERGYALTFREPNATKPLLVAYDVPQFNHVIFFSPSAKCGSLAFHLPSKVLLFLYSSLAYRPLLIFLLLYSLCGRSFLTNSPHAPATKRKPDDSTRTGANADAILRTRVRSNPPTTKHPAHLALPQARGPTHRRTHLRALFWF